MLKVCNESYFVFKSGDIYFCGTVIVTCFFILVSDFAISFFRIDDGTQYVLFVDIELCECKIFGAMLNSRDRLFSSIC